MSKMFFDADPVMRIRRDAYIDSDGEIGIHTQADVEGIVEVNRASFAAHDERTRYGEMDRVASIPVGVYMELERKGIVQDERAFRRWLDDPDQRAFRTRPGRLSR